MVLELGNLASYFICVARIKIDLENDMRVWGFSRVVFFFVLRYEVYKKWKLFTNTDVELF